LENPVNPENLNKIVVQTNISNKNCIFAKIKLKE